MNSQQLYDYIIKPTHEYMGGNYESKNANFLSLCTAAIESQCGYYIKQVGGPALGPWQMEPATFEDIDNNCDALRDTEFKEKISELITAGLDGEEWFTSAIDSLKLSCAFARLKYSMDKALLPDHNDFRAVYDYYKRIYNTPLGASTYEKFKQACVHCKVFDVKL